MKEIGKGLLVLCVLPIIAGMVIVFFILCAIAGTSSEEYTQYNRYH